MLVFGKEIILWSTKYFFNIKHTWAKKKDKFSSYWLSFTLQVYVLFMLYVYSYWCPTQFPYHSLFNSNMMAGASGAGTGYPPEHPRSHPFFSRVHVAQSLVFCLLFCWPLFVFFFFFFWPLHNLLRFGFVVFRSILWKTLAWHIISPLCHKTSLDLQPAVPTPESEWSCIYICVRGIHFVSVSMIFLLIDFRKCSDSVVFFVFLLIDFGTVLTVWYFLFFLFFQNLSTKAKRTSKTVVKSMLPWNQFQQPLTMVTATYPCLC